METIAEGKINRQRKIPDLLVISLALLSIAIHILFHQTLEYHRDELLYFSLGLHPAFGYNSVPPLVGWIAMILKNVLGFSLLTVKIVPALLSGILVWLSARIAKELGGSGYSQVLTAIAILIMPVTLRVFHLYQPVSFDLTLWTLAMYWIIKYINTNLGKYMIYCGISIGIALLNKYLIVLLIIAFVISLVMVRNLRFLKSKEVVKAASVALLIFLPNLIWQIANGLPVINHMQELNESQLVHVDRSAFLIEQFLMPFASSLILWPGLLFLLLNKHMKKFRVLGITAIWVIVILWVLRGKSYYSIGVFPLLIASGTVWIGLSNISKYIKWGLPILLITVTIPIVPLGLPVYYPEGLVRYFDLLENQYGIDMGRRFEDGSIHSLPQDYADMIGWEELTKITSRAYRMVNPDEVVIFAENYGQAGAISLIGEKYGLPEAISFSGSFQYWIPLNFLPGVTTLIYINDELGDDIQRQFGDIKKIGQISNPHAREFGTTVYLCQNPTLPVNEFWQNVLNRVSN